MNGITTIASMPNGAGQAAHLPAEVGETRYATGGYASDEIACSPEAVKPRHFSAPVITVNIECKVDAKMLSQITDALKKSPSALKQWREKCRAKYDGKCQPTPADKQGFEPFELTERN